MTLQTHSIYTEAEAEMSMSNVNVKIVVILSKIIVSCAKSQMHIFNMLVISAQSIKLNAWKFWEDLITQSCYPFLKPNLKIVYVKHAIIL